MRGIMVAVAAGMAGLLAGATGGSAQTVMTGERVRLTLNSAGTATVAGRLIEIRGDRLVLDPGTSTSGPTWVLGRQVRSIDRSIGRRTRGAQGAVYGVIGGAAFGAVLGFLGGDDEPTRCASTDYGCIIVAPIVDHAKSRTSTATYGAMAGGVVGLVVGTVIGVATTTDRWEPVQAGDYPVKLAVRAVGARGPRAAFSYAFGSAPRK